MDIGWPSLTLERAGVEFLAISNYLFSGNYFCRVSGSLSSNEKRNNKDIDCSKGYRDSNICVMKVALPTNAEINNGDVEFSNEEIIILKHPDLSTNLESTNENSLPAPASNEYTASRRAAIGDKVCGSKWLSGYKMYVLFN